MAGETEGQEPRAAPSTGVDMAAAALALAGASRDKADGYLDDQREMLRLQMEELREEMPLKFSHLRIRRFSDYSKMAFEISVGLFFLIVVAGFGTMVWSAVHANSLLIEPFSVPPDLAQRGMTGQVVAAEVLDHLSEMQAQTRAARQAQTYASDWGQTGIRLDIPETGISLTELDQFLREKLGNDAHITGEIVHTGSGLSLTARSGVEGAANVVGSETDLNGLVRQLSENIYRLTQPYRYGLYLASHDRIIEAMTVLKTVAETGPTRLDRASAYADWCLLSADQIGIDVSLRRCRQALAVEPDNIAAQMNIAGQTMYKSLPEQSLREYQKELALLASDKLGMFSGTPGIPFKRYVQALIDPLLGDFQDAVRINRQIVQSGTYYSYDQAAILAGDEANAHDLAAARAALTDSAIDPFDYMAGETAKDTLLAKLQIDSEAQNWSAVLSDLDESAPTLRKYPGVRTILPMSVVPFTAYAEARLGRFSDAEMHIAITPADCYNCLIVRAQIAELQGRHARADYWFARAIAGQKSIPFAYAYWGQALLARGQPDAAIAKLKIANQKGPHFADALEIWGEALMAKNRSDLALAKFAEADEYAPKRGRLHLKWGEALFYAGRKEEAKAQFATARNLELRAADKAELAKWTGTRV